MKWDMNKIYIDGCHYYYEDNNEKMGVVLPQQSATHLVKHIAIVKGTKPIKNE